MSLSFCTYVLADLTLACPLPSLCFLPQAALKQREKSLEQGAGERQKMLKKRSQLLEKKEEMTRKIRDLGPLTQDAFETHNNRNLKEVCVLDVRAKRPADCAMYAVCALVNGFTHTVCICVRLAVSFSLCCSHDLGVRTCRTRSSKYFRKAHPPSLYVFPKAHPPSTKWSQNAHPTFFVYHRPLSNILSCTSCSTAATRS